MVNYQNGLIYKIVCNDLSIKQVYYGSTTNFDQRVKQHKRTCDSNTDKCRNHPKYKFIRENGGFQNWKMVLIKEFPCNSKRELERGERYEMEKDNNRLNKIIPTRTDKEYYEVNKKKFKEYYEDNKKKILERMKIYNENNKKARLEKNKEKVTCECGTVLANASIFKHKNSQKHLKFLENK
tara:strand:- start:69 stop:611 length:543 start_codon:yes stop_codon:yes gene_type:complete